MICSGSGVREWTTVTVASSFKSSNETGNPTMLLLPTTTAFLPFILTPLRERSSRHPCAEKNLVVGISTLKSKCIFLGQKWIRSLLHIKHTKRCWLKTNSLTYRQSIALLMSCLWGARKEQRVSAFHSKLANVEWMKPIYILLNADFTQNFLFIYMLGQWKLNQNTCQKCNKNRLGNTEKQSTTTLIPLVFLWVWARIKASPIKILGRKTRTWQSNGQSKYRVKWQNGKWSSNRVHPDWR